MGDEVRRAATLMVLREAATASGMEVLMVQRHRRAGFLPNAWVFPGGVVEGADGAVDLARGGREAAAQMGISEAVARGFLVGAVRETWEEVGLWLGTGGLPEEAREPVARGERHFGALLAESGASVDLDVLRPWSWWITPREEPRRYDTRFFVAVAPAGAEGRVDARETVDARWICPAEAHGAALAELAVAPPTWWTLGELAKAGSVAGVLGAAGARANVEIQPRMVFDESGMRLMMEAPGMPRCVVSRGGRWVADE